ncbi:MAG: 50S ribosomal protein L6 [Candidatus Moeniiplasma glomeromycotorum]|nr:50S ribosomal protein L6 [Candidatus Moeniiplasma glomeromycotorum]
MSKIANRTISIPEKVIINLGEQVIYAEGPLGKSEILTIPDNIEIINQNNKLITKSTNLALAGTYNALISNLVKGVTEGYQETLEVKGAGYKVMLKNDKLEFELGKSYKVNGTAKSVQDIMSIPTILKVAVERDRKILIKGTDKQKVRQFATDIQRLRKPSIYRKSDGIYFLGEEETIKLRAKKAANK